MTRELAIEQWNRQLLQRDRRLSVVEVVEMAGGIYSTAPTSYLSFAARIPGFHRSQLDDALSKCRSLARLGALRGSGFLIPAADREPWYTNRQGRCGDINGRPTSLPARRKRRSGGELSWISSPNNRCPHV